MLYGGGEPYALPAILDRYHILCSTSRPRFAPSKSLLALGKGNWLGVIVAPVSQELLLDQGLDQHCLVRLGPGGAGLLFLLFGLLFAFRHDLQVKEV